MGVICIVAVMQTQYKCLGIHIINLHENHLLKALSFFKDLENPLITLEMVDASKEATSDSAFSNKKDPVTTMNMLQFFKSYHLFIYVNFI